MRIKQRHLSEVQNQITFTNNRVSFVDLFALDLKQLLYKLFLVRKPTWKGLQTFPSKASLSALEKQNLRHK